MRGRGRGGEAGRPAERRGWRGAGRQVVVRGRRYEGRGGRVEGRGGRWGEVGRLRGEARGWRGKADGQEEGRGRRADRVETQEGGQAGGG